MTLCDAGPLIALVDPRRSTAQDRCMKCLSKLPAPLIVVWPVITEAMYFAAKLGGWHLQKVLWERLQDRDAAVVHVPANEELERIRGLMEQYSDAPMDLADAAIVAAAETLGIRTVFTLDKHFQAYRTCSGEAFEIYPGNS